MEESEVPLEKLQDDIRERAEKAQDRWISRVAVATAILAALAAVSSLLAGHHANEAMIDQIQASDQWSLFQAKGIKSEVMASKLELLAAVGHQPKDEDRAHLGKYDQDREESRAKAADLQQSSKYHLRHHVILARGVTMFQIAIAVAAIAVLVEKRGFAYLALGMGLLGVVFLVQGILPVTA